MDEVSLEEITSAMKKMKLGKASGLSAVSMEMISASGKVGVREYLMEKERRKIGKLMFWCQCTREKKM